MALNWQTGSAGQGGVLVRNFTQRAEAEFRKEAKQANSEYTQDQEQWDVGDLLGVYQCVQKMNDYHKAIAEKQIADDVQLKNIFAAERQIDSDNQTALRVHNDAVQAQVAFIQALRETMSGDISTFTDAGLWQRLQQLSERMRETVINSCLQNLRFAKTDEFGNPVLDEMGNLVYDYDYEALATLMEAGDWVLPSVLNDAMIQLFRGMDGISALTFLNMFGSKDDNGDLYKCQLVGNTVWYNNLVFQLYNPLQIPSGTFLSAPWEIYGKATSTVREFNMLSALGKMELEGEDFLGTSSAALTYGVGAYNIINFAATAFDVTDARLTLYTVNGEATTAVLELGETEKRKTYSSAQQSGNQIRINDNSSPLAGLELARLYESTTGKAGGIAGYTLQYSVDPAHGENGGYYAYVTASSNGNVTLANIMYSEDRIELIHQGESVDVSHLFQNTFTLKNGGLLINQHVAKLSNNID